MISLSSLILKQKNALHSASPWRVILDIPLTSLSQTLRVVDDHEPITWNGNIYYPARLFASENTSKSDGSLETMTLGVGNVSQQLRDFVLNGNLRGARVTMRAVNGASNLEAISWDFEIIALNMTAQEVTCTLGHANVFSMPFPKNRFSRSRCGWVYKDAACGYTLGLVSCDKQLDSDNGCRVHGADEVAAGQTKKHPNRYGGFPSIPNDR